MNLPPIHLRICLLLVVTVAFLSCLRSSTPIAPLPFKPSAADYAAFTRATGIATQKTVEILTYENDKERLPGLEIWIMFFPTEVSSNEIAPGRNWLESRLLDGSIAAIEQRLSPRKIGRAIRGYSAEWTINGRLIQADVLQTDRGNYLQVIGAPN